jgi:hypothetical protein
MTRLAFLLFAIAIAIASGVVGVLAEMSAPTTEPPADLVVDPPVADLLAQGIVWIPWRAENVQIKPVFGKDALNASPPVAHLHIHVDDLPWLWAQFSDNPIDVAFLPPGQHQIRVELVNANHQGVLSKTVTFTVPERAAAPSHSH